MSVDGSEDCPANMLITFALETLKNLNAKEPREEYKWKILLLQTALDWKEVLTDTYFHPIINDGNKQGIKK